MYIEDTLSGLGSHRAGNSRERIEGSPYEYGLGSFSGSEETLRLSSSLFDYGPKGTLRQVEGTQSWISNYHHCATPLSLMPLLLGGNNEAVKLVDLMMKNSGDQLTGLSLKYLIEDNVSELKGLDLIFSLSRLYLPQSRFSSHVGNDEAVKLVGLTMKNSGDQLIGLSKPHWVFVTTLTLISTTLFPVCKDSLQKLQRIYSLQKLNENQTYEDPRAKECAKRFWDRENKSGFETRLEEEIGQLSEVGQVLVIKLGRTPRKIEQVKLIIFGNVRVRYTRGIDPSRGRGVNASSGMSTWAPGRLSTATCLRCMCRWVVGPYRPPRRLLGDGTVKGVRETHLRDPNILKYGLVGFKNDDESEPYCRHQLYQFSEPSNSNGTAKIRLQQRREERNEDKFGVPKQCSIAMKKGLQQTIGLYNLQFPTGTYNPADSYVSQPTIDMVKDDEADTELTSGHHHIKTVAALPPQVTCLCVLLASWPNYTCPAPAHPLHVSILNSRIMS
ncbi:hypothetical protein Scep_016985 [Stephania cephalantha]|uniref:Uncharacterized protein n=1 Tax=Stephania cephalantha TaxID=152367 RepID=A0AAP0IQL8_9MAGN